METSQVISFVGALGIGSFIGIFIQSFFNQKLNDKKMLFDARVKAYSGLTGRIFNLFLEPDVASIKEDVLVFAKLNQLFSEAMLMASHELSEKLGEYKALVYEFHMALDQKDEQKSKETHKKLVRLSGEIHVQMRKDLHVDNQSVFDSIGNQTYGTKK